MFRSIAAQQLFNELVQRLPTFLAPRAASVELNEGLTQIYDDLKNNRLESFVEPGTRKRNILGRSVAQRAAEKLDAALAAGAPPKFTEKAIAASLASPKRKRLASTTADEPHRAAKSPPPLREGLTKGPAASLAARAKRKRGQDSAAAAQGAPAVTESSRTTNKPTGKPGRRRVETNTGAEAR